MPSPSSRLLFVSGPPTPPVVCARSARRAAREGEGCRQGRTGRAPPAGRLEERSRRGLGKGGRTGGAPPPPRGGGGSRPETRAAPTGHLPGRTSLADMAGGAVCGEERPGAVCSSGEMGEPGLRVTSSAVSLTLRPTKSSDPETGASFQSMARCGRGSCRSSTHSMYCRTASARPVSAPAVRWRRRCCHGAVSAIRTMR